MQIILCSDLHLGGGGDGRWHNRLLYDRAATIARRTVAMVNQLAPDAVLILGDVTENGRPEALHQAHALLAELAPPWYVVPGNHDRASLRDGSFDAVFGPHALPPSLSLPAAHLVSVREQGQVPPEVDAYWLDEQWATQALDGLAVADPRLPLLVISHFPLLSEAAWAQAQGHRDAGYLNGGSAWVARLRQAWSGPRPLVLCGHSHWHRVSEGPDARQVTTAALIEYPMEVRRVTLRGLQVCVETLPTGAPAEARASIDTAPTVAGEAADRQAQFNLAASTGR